ncbi:MAG: hypothetical protein HRU23_12185 [Gammaproteobacteria bacterium]|nr:hypothetical protein [Gammaproteobacteria bacterium]
MKKQISNSTFFDKKVFPSLLFTFLTFMVISVPLAAGENGTTTMGSIAILAAILMAIFGYIFMQEQFFDLMDEVYDDGDALVFKNSGKEIRVNLRDILDLSSEMTSARRKVTLLLNHETELGHKLTFYTRGNFLPHQNNLAVNLEELNNRITLARGH